MAEKKLQTPKSQSVFYLLLVVSLCVAGYYAYLFGDTFIKNRMIDQLQTTIVKQNEEIAQYALIPGFTKLQEVKKLEEQFSQMPWSEHIKAVLEILDKIQGVDNSDGGNISLSDFRISLEEIGLKGYVSNLKVLYNKPENSDFIPLIDRFEQLEFVRDLSIKTYEQTEGMPGFEFLLTAKVVNDAE